MGCALGALSCAFIGDILGRRRMIFVAGCTALVGITLQTTPFSLAQLIVATVITGELQSDLTWSQTIQTLQLRWCVF